jgi:hypothetical protein
MKKFMLLTYGFETPTPALMAAWGQWQGSVADRIVEHGGFQGGREVLRSGTRDLPLTPDAITGYCILEAESLDEAEAIARRTPFMTGIRVYEMV